MLEVMGQMRTGNPLVTAGRDRSPTMDIVFVVRPGESNEVLRYSLRSLVNLPHRQVYISGYCPSWVKNVIYIATDQEGNDDLDNSNHNLICAAIREDLSDNFILMNDDFFIMAPADVVPPMHQGSLDGTIERYKTGNRFGQAYSLIKTRQWLFEARVGRLYSAMSSTCPLSTISTG